MKKYLLFSFIPLFGCLEFFAPNVDGIAVTLIAPQDSVITNNSEILFLWEGDSNVESYRFQLAQPSFQAPESLVDTLVDENRLEVILTEGNFEWQVRAEHSGSFSAFSRQQGWVDRTPPLTPILISPLNRDTVNNPIILTWESQDNLSWANVTDSVWLYREVDSVLQLVAREVTDQQSWDLGALEPGRYVWEVKSVDAAGNGSGLSTQSVIFIR